MNRWATASQVYAVQGGRVARVVISEGPGFFSLGLTQNSFVTTTAWPPARKERWS
ncbi:MAG TPA: hypothetical protein VI365_27770 [Trebonia sp.]